MREESVARRYAAALFQQAQKTNRLTDTYNELKIIGETVEKTPKLAAILAQPLLTEQQKKNALQTVFGRSVSKPTLFFLDLLVDKRRIGILDEVVAEFVRMVRLQQNIELAVATTAVPLQDNEKTALMRSLETRTGKKIELQTEVDPSVLGGVRVRIGDTVLDGTVQGNLERLREQLLVRR